jgi:hypothetical protein
MAAINFVDAGAGAATVTNGADLQPACPATVDANNILIAHVSYKGTTDGPSTPADWEPLFGPVNVGTTVAARHWIFGKIAVGDEDGDLISFGTAGGTTHRYARIYRFSGWVAGTITQIVPAASFTSIPHATDPQGPSVTTTLVGARAVAAMTQSDDNAVAAIAGMSGGTWTEAVAEYLTALGTGASLILNTCVPTADPGTVSGGAIAAANDPSGTIGFEIRSNPPAQNITPAAVTVSVTVGSLVVTPPPQNVTPGAVTVTVTAGSLVVRREEQVVPGAVTVTATPGSLDVVLGGGLPQDVTLVGPTVTATPGSPAAVREEQIIPAAVTVTVSPGALVVTPPDQTIVPAPVTVAVDPGLLTVLPDQPVDVTAPTVTVSSGTVIVEIPPAVDPTGAIVTVAPGVIVVLPVRKTKWKAQLEDLRWYAQLKRKRLPPMS